MALGGSPAKQITGGGVTGNVMIGPSMMQQQQHLQHMSSTGYSSPQHQMYSSPAKQQSGVGGLCCSIHKCVFPYDFYLLRLQVFILENVFVNAQVIALSFYLIFLREAVRLCGF